ncbi:hypothetical protein ACWC9R_36510, partial [Streptomyces sp. NPDC001219]
MPWRVSATARPFRGPCSICTGRPGTRVGGRATGYYFEDKAAAYGLALVAVLAYAGSLLLDSR